MTPTARGHRDRDPAAPDHTRVIARFFVPGHEDVGPGDSRAAPVIERLLRLDERDVEAAFRDVDDRFSNRHESLHQIFSEHASMVTSRIDPDVSLSKARRLLLGASFTHEYSIEGAALCNPSAVVHPQQDESGDAAFILSVRGIGEGHRSSIGFRTGTLSATGVVTIDPSGPFPRTGTATQGLHHREVFHGKLADLGDDHENAAYVLDPLPERFDNAQLRVSIDRLAADRVTRRNTATTIANLRNIARASYQVEFAAIESVVRAGVVARSARRTHGMEDADLSGSSARWRCHLYGPTRPSMASTSRSNYSRPPTLPRSPRRRSPAPPRSAKGLALVSEAINGRYAALHEPIGRPTPSPFPTTSVAGTQRTPSRPPIGVGDPTVGQLRLTDRNRSGLARTHTRRRRDAHLRRSAALLLDLDEPQRVIAR